MHKITQYLNKLLRNLKDASHKKSEIYKLAVKIVTQSTLLKHVDLLYFDSKSIHLIYGRTEKSSVAQRAMKIIWT